MKRCILVVEDEKDIRELIAYYLRKADFDVEECADGSEALRLIQKNRYDLALLDLMLPGIHGMDLCRTLKSDDRTSSLPIIIVTAKTDDYDKVHGLEAGADDYITKPFNPREVVARVKAVLRRTIGKPDKEKIIKVGALEINAVTYSVAKNGENIGLSATEFNLLKYMAERPGRVLSRDMLLDAVWRGDAFVEPRTVDVHIRRLRAQIEDDPSNPEYIKTKRGVGYFFEKDI